MTLRAVLAAAEDMGREMEAAAEKGEKTHLPLVRVLPILTLLLLERLELPLQ